MDGAGFKEEALAMQGSSTRDPWLGFGGAAILTTWVRITKVPIVKESNP